MLCLVACQVFSRRAQFFCISALPGGYCPARPPRTPLDTLQSALQTVQARTQPFLSPTPFKGSATANCFHLHPRRRAPRSSRVGFSSFPLLFAQPRHGERRRAGISAPSPITRQHFLKFSSFIIFICQLFCANISFPLASFTLTPPPPPFLFLFSRSQEIRLSVTLQQGTTGLGKTRTGTKPPGNQTGQPGQRRPAGNPQAEPGEGQRRGAPGGWRLAAVSRWRHTSARSARPRKEPRSSGPAAAQRRRFALRFCPAPFAFSRRKHSLRQSCGGPGARRLPQRDSRARGEAGAGPAGSGTSGTGAPSPRADGAQSCSCLTGKPRPHLSQLLLR